MNGKHNHGDANKDKCFIDLICFEKIKNQIKKNKEKLLLSPCFNIINVEKTPLSRSMRALHE